MRISYALEGIDEADSEVIVIALGNLGIGAGGSDRRDLGLLKIRAAGNGAAGTIGTQYSGHALGNQLLGSGGRLGRIGLVIGIGQLDFVFLTANGNGGIQRIGVLDAEDLFFAAGAVLAGGGFKHADGDNFFIGGGGILFAAAGYHGNDHDQAQQNRDQFFHLSIPPYGMMGLYLRRRTLVRRGKILVVL